MILLLKTMVNYSAIALLLLSIQVIHAQNTVCFDIAENPNANSTAFSDFTKYIRVLDCFSIYAETSIPDEKVLHAAAVAAELLDNNEDGEVDDPVLKAELAANGALIPIFAYDGSSAMENFFDQHNRSSQILSFSVLALSLKETQILNQTPRFLPWNAVIYSSFYCLLAKFSLMLI